MSDDIADLEPTAGGSGMKPPACEYAVGYGRPPRRYQFSKGKSGNPKGRPKESKSLAVYFERMLDEDDVSYKSGAHVRSKRDTIMHTLFERAAKCNRRSFARFMGYARRSGLLDRPAQPCGVERRTAAGLLDMEKFKAEFGKPMPDADQA